MQISAYLSLTPITTGDNNKLGLKSFPEIITPFNRLIEMNKRPDLEYEHF